MILNDQYRSILRLTIETVAKAIDFFYSTKQCSLGCSKSDNSAKMDKNINHFLKFQ